MTLVDTPGHIDFASEVDRALSILDAIILVVSAKEGVQAHTLNLWESIRERNIPTLLFINKIDREGVDLEQVFFDLEKDLSIQLFALNYGDVSDPNNPITVDFKESKSFLTSPILEKSLENLAEVDESFLGDYLESKIGELNEIYNMAFTQTQENNLIGAIFGSAKLDLGVTLLLDTISSFHNTRKEFQLSASAKVFKVEYDPKLGRLAHFKSYGSVLRSKDSIWSQYLQKNIKINQLYQQNLGNLEQIDELSSGEIGIMTTSDKILVGDVLGEETYSNDFKPISQSVLQVQAIADEEKDYQKLGEALEILDVEDPQLKFDWNKTAKEFHLNILGPIQTEVLKESLESRFGILAHFLTPKVIYKETPSKSAEGYVRYWMPKPCWAIMTFLIEPGALGSGVKFNSKVRTSDISTKYLNEVKRAIPWSLEQGIKGWEVTDIEITLIEGSEHTVHSNPGDFLLATPMGILRGLEASGTDLLEPMYAFQIKANQEFLGAIASDLNQLQAQIGVPIFDGDFFTLSGRVSVEKAMNYGIQFNATTSGKGRLKLTLDGYEKTIENIDQKTRTYQGVSPLDEAQWILHKRGAFKAESR